MLLTAAAVFNAHNVFCNEPIASVMDSDEFDGDDIADEDLIVAATQATSPIRNVSNSARHQSDVRTSASSASFNSSLSRQPRRTVSWFYLRHVTQPFYFTPPIVSALATSPLTGLRPSVSPSLASLC